MNKTFILPIAIIISSVFFRCNSNIEKEINAGRPNIIFILADDLSYRDLSIYGQEQFSTPHLDNLARGGIRFTQAYAAAPECAPSRCSLLTGKHTGHSAIRTNSSARGQDNLRDEDVTIAEVLKEAGYRTGFTGKWGIGLPGTEGVPYKQGFDYAFGYYDQGRAHTFIPYYLWENDQKKFYPQNFGFDMKRRYDYTNSEARNTYDQEGKLFIGELKDPYGYAYSENEIEKAAHDFIERNAPGKTGKPFFLYYATQLPHGPVIVDDLGKLQEPKEIMQVSREWAAMVVKLDVFTGNLIAQLKELGAYENTVIFFASDNGYSMCGYTDRGNGPAWPDDPWLKNKGPFTGGKFSVLEGGCRIPFFISWPNHIEPAIRNDIVWLPDFFPTAMELANAPDPALELDGTSLIPLFTGDKNKFVQHEFLYFSKGREQAVRLGPWKAYRKSPASKTRLHLIEEDTYAEKDLSSFYPEIVKRAESIMQSEHVPHEWYWNPSESAAEFKKKKERAEKTGNLLPRFRPNDNSMLPPQTK
ncbi:MAG: arylsulfatase [Cytophagales bacterium]|nr:arylsulfatase [Cytophagales bacterium]